jgi:hypothetical protein
MRTWIPDLVIGAALSGVVMIAYTVARVVRIVRGRVSGP